MTTKLTAPLEIDELTTGRELEALRPEWAALWRRCSSATPFQSPQWGLAWWKQFGTGMPWVLALRCEGRLMGVVPLYFLERGDRAERTLIPIGAGTTDHLDPLFDPGVADVAAEMTLARLGARRSLWDRCEFQHLGEDSPLLSAPVPAGCADETAVQDACPVLQLPELVGELSECLPGNQLKKLRYYRRRAAREGEIRIEQATGASFDELFDALLRLHAARWKSREMPGVLADPAVREFHREAACNLLRLGALRLYALRIGGQIVACYYGFVHRRQAFYYLGGFDPEFSSLSPGLLVVGHAIEQAVREGARAFDFLRGREGYKYAWGAVDRLNSRRSIWNDDRPTSTRD